MVGHDLNFGRKLGVFKANTTHFAIPLGSGLLLALFGLVRFVQAVIQQSDLNMFNLVLAILLFYLAGVLLFMAYGRYQEMQISYHLFERGVERHDGVQRAAISWDEVRQVRRASEQGNRGATAKRSARKNMKQSMYLIGPGGKNLTINDQPHLAGMILGMLKLHHWPIVKEQIDQGKKIYLGRVQVSHEGLEYKGRVVPWSMIHKANTTGHLRLDTVSGQINWPEINDQNDKDVLGYLLLQRVIEYYVGRVR